ncbi:helix-turn-helix domain-containing protein [Subtercola boreus]|uniref:helix-turn-helix domain-containing protein n=1 Tax=Subtercola boreus TaxID=120213 RepID=UPI00209C48B2|nr:helix-turn-helix domain-containing protein [Subtercola boreus]
MAEVADSLSISRQRVLSMVNAGQIPAQRIGRAWAIDARELDRRSALSRPLSRRMALVLSDAISGQSVRRLSSTERHYAQKYLALLAAM